MVENIKFKESTREGSFIGKCSFTYDKKFAFNNVPVHRRLDPKVSVFRVLYPDMSTKTLDGTWWCPISKECQQEIDVEISGYLCANFSHLKEFKK